MDDIKQMVQNALIAQKQWEMASQEEVDIVVREIARTVYDNVEYLAKITVDETGLGNYEFNILQGRRKSEIIWYGLKGKKSRGIIGEDKDKKLVYIARPVGIVGAVLPVTIPVTNFMSNAMFSLKCGNAIIFAPHPSAKKTISVTAEMVIKAIKKFDAPDNIIQYLKEPSKESTQELMRYANVVVATGGMGMVRAAYSSGRPAYGVGPGNVQCIIDRDVDIDSATKKIVASRVFNYGIPCASEQAVIVPEEKYEDIVEFFKKNGVEYISEDEKIEKLTKALFVEGELNRECIGISAYDVAKYAGFSVPEDTQVILIRGDLNNQNPILRREKLCPVLMIYSYSDFDEAIAIAKSNLEIDGKGHSVVIHSNNKENIEKFALAVHTSRVVVNQSCNFVAGGGFTIGFAPTTTLGCGTWENNIISENLTYTHLMNLCRIGYPITDKIPTSEEIWG